MNREDNGASMKKRKKEELLDIPSKGNMLKWALLGALALGVVVAITPIEQIQKGKDLIKQTAKEITQLFRK